MCRLGAEARGQGNRCLVSQSPCHHGLTSGSQSLTKSCCNFPVNLKGVELNTQHSILQPPLHRRKNPDPKRAENVCVCERCVACRRCRPPTAPQLYSTPVAITCGSGRALPQAYYDAASSGVLAHTPASMPAASGDSPKTRVPRV